jgi:hypothetical protein
MTAFRTNLWAAGMGIAALWSLQGVSADTPGAKPGDEGMTCAQIAAELAPYTKQMAGDVGPLLDTTKQIMARAKAQQAEATTEAMAISAGAMASSADPTGLASKAYGQAEVAMQRALWERSAAQNKPLEDQAKRQLNEFVPKAKAMESNARLQRLMQLAEEKKCQ